jgi:hypothetical protein
MSDYFEAVELAEFMGVTVGHVRNMASKHGWRRLHVRPERYHIVDVMKTLDRAKGLRM